MIGGGTSERWQGIRPVDRPKRTALRSAVLFGIAALLSWTISQIHPNHRLVTLESIPAIDLEEATNLRPLWVDARSAEEFARHHIPGAIAFGDRDWEAGFARVASRLQPGTNVVVYCGDVGCHRSQETAMRLRQELRWKSVFVLRGGFAAWQAKNTPSP